MQSNLGLNKTLHGALGRNFKYKYTTKEERVCFSETIDSWSDSGNRKMYWTNYIRLSSLSPQFPLNVATISPHLIDNLHVRLIFYLGKKK
jgi:hypothetical protein